MGHRESSGGADAGSPSGPQVTKLQASHERWARLVQGDSRAAVAQDLVMSPDCHSLSLGHALLTPSRGCRLASATACCGRCDRRGRPLNATILTLEQTAG